MLFDSINYFFFLLVVFIAYYLVPSRLQWAVILVASIFFYLFAGTSTIIVLVSIIVGTYVIGRLVEKEKNQKRKKFYFLSGLILNLGLLIFFKYINFFLSTAIEGFNTINHILNQTEPSGIQVFSLKLIVPLGISYITFQAISYLTEINRGNQVAEKNLGIFAAYLFFFPKLLSGPIERAHNFIPQLKKTHVFNYDQTVEGLKRILFGLFKKLVIANRLAVYTDEVFNNIEHHSSITLILACVFYTVQLYADFSGYTDIAIGSAKIFGFKLMENFDHPFSAKSVTDFWRKWHISLTTWVNEYIYNPILINCRNWNKWAVVYAAIVTFLILGFWHGASWNFIIFGFLQGAILSLEFLTRKARKHLRKKIPNWLNSSLGMAYVFLYFTFSLIFFRTNTPHDAYLIIQKASIFTGGLYVSSFLNIIISFSGVALLMLAEFKQYNMNSFAFFNDSSRLVRNISFSILIIVILFVGVLDSGKFIYFQF